jgi:hypothetical protein
MDCVHCGSAVLPLRRDEQVTHSMTVILDWYVCSSCKHVALGGWEILHSYPSIHDVRERSSEFRFNHD